MFSQILYTTDDLTLTLLRLALGVVFFAWRISYGSSIHFRQVAFLEPDKYSQTANGNSRRTISKSVFDSCAPILADSGTS